MMVSIDIELDGAQSEIQLVFRPQISGVLDMSLKGGKMWTRFQNIQIYSKTEKLRLLSVVNKFTLRRWGGSI